MKKSISQSGETALFRVKWSKIEFLFFFFSKTVVFFRLEGRAKTPERGSTGAGTNPQRRETCVLPRSFCCDDKLHARDEKTQQKRNRFENSKVCKICIYVQKAVPLQPNSKTAYTMKKQEIKFDKRNYRKHDDENKRVIQKSLEELGAGRSIVIDNEGEIIAGNGVYEQAQKLGIKTKIVETDGSELVVVKRTDLATGDDKRKKLALADNAASDTSEWADELLREDWTSEVLAEFGVVLPDVKNDEEVQRRLDEFKEKIAAGEMREEDEEYQQFLDKFKLKKTTDDCYTPDIVYNAVADWVAKEYGLDRKNFVRPFYPGGDYQKEKYPKGCVVVDNPPFSILAEILTYYKERGVKFFLFAPHLTLFSSSSSSSSSSALVTGVGITYENGANVNTSFLTNLEPEEVRARSCPSLYAAVKTANDANLAQMRKELPKFSYDHHVVTAPMLSPFSRLGIDFIMTKAETVAISQLDAQKESGKVIYGKGYLISERLFAEREKAEREKAEREKAEREKAEREKAERWELSEREKSIIKKLSKQ